MTAGSLLARQRRRHRLASLTLVSVLAGCGSTCGDSTSPGTIGELGNGRFLYECGGTSDPVCEHSSNGDYFPECIVLGGGFDLEYELIDASALESNELTPVLYVESINQGFFRGTDDFEALRVGEAAFVVRESERVLDLIHLDIVEPDSIDVFARDPATPTTTVELGVGETEVLRVFPRNLGCPQLGGAVPIEADSSDTAIVSLSAGDVLRIQGQAEGTAVVRVRIGALEQAITVQVGATPIDPETESATSDTGPGTSGSSGASTSDSTGSSSGGSTGGSSSGTASGGT